MHPRIHSEHRLSKLVSSFFGGIAGYSAFKPIAALKRERTRKIALHSAFTKVNYSTPTNMRHQYHDQNIECSVYISSNSLTFTAASCLLLTFRTFSFNR